MAQLCKESDPDERSFLAKPRSDLYGFLATAFLKLPGKELIEAVTREDLLEDLATMFGETAVSGLRSLAGQPNELARIRQSYMDLFKIPQAKFVAPFESVYNHKASGEPGRPRLMGDEAATCMSVYLHEGRAELAHKGIMPDHIGVQLEYMHYLCEKESEAAEQEKNKTAEIQIRFLRQHLANWLPNLAQAICKVDDDGFYSAIALLASGFVEWDLAMLSERN